MSNQSKSYGSFLDVMNDPLFAQADAMLRAGINIVPEDNTLHSFVELAHDHLEAYFLKVHMKLRCSPEQVYYNQMIRGNGIPQRKMSELTMVIGLIMVSINLDLRKSLEGSSWISIDTLIDQMMDKLSDERMRDLFGPGRIGTMTQFDIDKIRESVMKCLRDLDRKNFIRLEKETRCYSPTAAIYRFIDPLRGVTNEGEVLDRLSSLIMEGYLVQNPEGTQGDDGLQKDDVHWTTKVAADAQDNAEIFCDQDDDKYV